MVPQSPWLRFDNVRGVNSQLLLDNTESFKYQMSVTRPCLASFGFLSLGNALGSQHSCRYLPECRGK